MQWSDLLAAIALVFVLEGIMPFVAPAAWKRMMAEVLRLDDRALRVVGIMSMLAGLILLAIVR